ncbi:MAG: zinc ABC transporter substrate-binding protein [Chlamydiia bacterium]|nr:zinc ABC transporter substrate-binding protein [Chlamydiia bacterium]MCP5510138.1 zinc ABC transporter substrate-binding protein [Chlamydiales bacterium]
MIKRFFLLLIVAVGCTSNNAHSLKAWMKDSKKIKVLSTVAMIDDLVRGVGGEHVDCLALIHGEIDPHSYELVKGDAEKFGRADIVFANGLGLEHGPSLCRQLKEHQKCVTLGDHLYRQCREELLVIDGQLDPHVWMDVALWIRCIDPIVWALSEKDPEHKAAFQKNGAELKAQLLKVHAQIYEQMQAVPESKRFLVTSHDAFNYFARRYLSTADELGSHSWKKRVAAPEGLSPDGQLTPRDIQEISAHIERYKVSVVFPESNVNQAALMKVLDVCQKRGHKVRIIDGSLYGDAMGESYAQMMLHNAALISQGLHG